MTGPSYIRIKGIHTAHNVYYFLFLVWQVYTPVFVIKSTVSEVEGTKIIYTRLKSVPVLQFDPEDKSS